MNKVSVNRLLADPDSDLNSNVQILTGEQEGMGDLWKEPQGCEQIEKGAKKTDEEAGRRCQ